MDKLETMFKLQYELNKRIGVDTNEIKSDEDQIRWIKQYVLSLQQELAELIDSVPWKHWKKNQRFDRENLKIEIVDSFHFLISVAQVAGMSAEDVFALYTDKNKVNHKRQDDGY